MKAKINLTTLVLFVIVCGVSASTSQRARPTSQRNKPPSIQSFTSSKTDLDLCPVFPDGSCGYIVKLEVKADDANNDRLTYRYWVSLGQIVGSGAQVDWDLRKGPAGSLPGQQTARVEVTDGRGGKANSSVSVNVQICPNCDIGCPAVAVTSPDTVSEGEVAVFNVTVSGSDPEAKLRYKWKVTNGEIVKGQDSRVLSVRASGLVGESVTSTVEVEGLDPSCSRQASATSKIQKRKP